MAGTKPVPAKAAAERPGRKGKVAAPPSTRGPAAGVTAAGEAATPRLAAAKGMPGWRAARTVLGEALAAANSALLLEFRDKAVSVRRCGGSVWQPAVPLAGDDPAAAFAALVKLVPAPGTQRDPGFVVTARKQPRRPCRVEARRTARGDQLVVLLGPALPPPERPRIGRLIAAVLGRLLPPFLKRTPPPPDRDPSLPAVDLVATGPDADARNAAADAADGYVPACDLVAAAVRDRACAIAIEGGPQGVTVQFDVDGVSGAAPGVEPGDVAAIVGALRAVAGIDPKARGPQAGRITAQVQGKPWPCTITARRGKDGERVEVVIDHVRPKFKTLADTGMPAAVAARLQEFLKLEGGMILLAGPPRGGLSTLCDTVITVADRLLRDFVVLEDEAAPRPEIQNVKPYRWDSRAGGKPVAALEAALREYPNVIATCDLADADLAKRLVAQAGEGRLVIAGIRAADAADGIARLAALGVDPRALARVLLGAVGVQLVRKLCPKCRQEYFPPVERIEKLKLDPDASVTLFRAAPSGCPVCTDTGHLGRTAVCELAAGPALRESVGRGDEAAKLRQAAAKDGMASLMRDAIDKAAAGVTSVEEVTRVFRKA
ncbi:MAG: ATPase, T2SS/T4P/T4SS family [Planctomycetaceae bacterium]